LQVYGQKIKSYKPLEKTIKIIIIAGKEIE